MPTHKFYYGVFNNRYFIFSKELEHIWGSNTGENLMVFPLGTQRMPIRKEDNESSPTAYIAWEGKITMYFKDSTIATIDNGDMLLFDLNDLDAYQGSNSGTKMILVF